MSLRAVLWLAVSTTEQADDDKMSLAQQEADARAIADKEGWQIVGIIRIPGHSRYYDTIAEAAVDMRLAGIDALDSFISHVERADFDVLIVRDMDRFGRTQSMVSEVMQKTYRIKARVFTLASNTFIEPGELGWRSAIGGLMSANDIERLVKYRHDGMRKKVSLGLPPHTPPFSHLLIRDERGRPSHLIPNEEKRTMIEEAVRLLIEGVGWRSVERELFKRFGYVAESGRPFSATTFLYLVFNPYFWGNSAYGRTNGKTVKKGLWAFDPSVKPPPGVSLFYGTHEPLLTGELSQKLRAEMHRRADSVKGSTRPQRPSVFAGLLVCGACGHKMTFHAGTYKKRVIAQYYICPSLKTGRFVCTNKGYPRVENLKAQIEPYLQRLIDGLPPDVLFETGADDTARRVAQIETDIEQAQEQARMLIRQQVRNPGLAEMYQDELGIVQARLAKLTEAHTAVSSAGVVVTQAQQAAVCELQHMPDAAAVWSLSDREINQLLHAILGKWKFMVLGTAITGLVIP